MTSNLPQPPIKNPIKGLGLTKPGIVILQFLLIAFVAVIEIFFRSNVGFLTGFAIWASYYGALIMDALELPMSQSLIHLLHLPLLPLFCFLLLADSH